MRAPQPTGRRPPLWIGSDLVHANNHKCAHASHGCHKSWLRHSRASLPSSLNPPHIEPVPPHPTPPRLAALPAVTLEGCLLRSPSAREGCRSLAWRAADPMRRAQMRRVHRARGPVRAVRRCERWRCHRFKPSCCRRHAMPSRKCAFPRLLSSCSRGPSPSLPVQTCSAACRRPSCTSGTIPS